MATTTISEAIRSILSSNPSLTTDEVIKRVKGRGVTASDESIRNNLYNIKSVMNKEAKAAKAAKPVPAAARETPAPKPGASATKSVPSAPGLTGVLANVALVNKVVDAAGGIDQVRQVAEAVRSCGGVEGFLQHLELVAGIRGA